tara:strand:- start:5557 stop:5778 length:222 start_codon:yes stop_codon:yes gene_type:complete
MSDDDQVTLNLGNGMSSSSMSAARSLFDEILNINTKISIMKQQGVEGQELSDLRSVRKYMKDRLEFYANGGCV